MILCDVNVLLHAMIAHSPHHHLCRSEIERARRCPDDFAVSDIVLAAVVRIGTNPRVYAPPPAPEAVFDFVDALRTQPGIHHVEPGNRHWAIFEDLVTTTGIRGPDTTDAYLAALAIESGCEWWTTDRGFERFAGLHWRYLLE
ncbi:MAG: PIN domain-containing protein [Candidatus Riflebacteria bacterium]|nr:PIN domain-containing protein [Candidatus Riflebacteria bacterium]